MKMRRSLAFSIAIISSLLSFGPSVALAQTSPNLSAGQVLTAGQWSNLFASKQDTLGFTPMNSNGGVFQGRVVTAPPGASISGFNLTPGSTPGSPANGDLWLTASGLFARVNGTTVGPLIGASGSSLTVGATPIGSGTTTRVLYDNAGVLGEYTNAQLTSLVNTFTTSLTGAVAASGSPSGKFLRDDNTWQLAGGTGTVTSAAYVASTGISISGTTPCTITCTWTFSNAGVLSIDAKTGAFTTGNGLDSTGGNVIELTAARRTLPTTQSLTSSGTYTTPANVLWLEVWIVGGGGGGNGAGNAATQGAGGNGTASIFNSIAANPGLGAPDTSANPPRGGLGGTGGTGTATLRIPGGNGQVGMVAVSNQTAGGAGGNSQFRLGGAPAATGPVVTGIAGTANTGGGGSGGGTNLTDFTTGGGGGGGETAYLIINSPAATYAYTIGTGGLAGVSNSNGGPGGTGFIFVIEHYGS
jgi:hypothetical protein